MGLKKKRRLPPEEYKKLCKAVLTRDGYRCIVCTSRNNLQVHHKIFRSQLGEDSMENLITLCNSCHEKIHHGKTNIRTKTV